MSTTFRLFFLAKCVEKIVYISNILFRMFTFKNLHLLFDIVALNLKRKHKEIVAQ